MRCGRLPGNTIKIPLKIARGCSKMMEFEHNPAQTKALSLNPKFEGGGAVVSPAPPIKNPCTSLGVVA
jgi:hypothetical protein